MLKLNPNKASAELCKRDFFYFVQEFWEIIIPEDPIWNWHIEYLCNELQVIVEAVAKRETKLYDLIINIPPGTSKSTIVTIMLPVWAWVIDPTIRTLSASYSGSLSMDHATKSRDIIRSDKFLSYFPNLEIKKDQDNKTHYKNNQGGERYATSVTGTVTGFHAHLIVVDDPLNPRESTSEVERKNANSFMDMTLSTRKVSKSVTPTILVMQRLHQDDCTGNWLDKKEKLIKHICLPGEMSNDIKPIELKENYVNGLLDPIRLSEFDLKNLKIDLGSYGYAGQIMQTPSPDEGGEWHRDWFTIIDKSELPPDIKWEMFIDGAYTKETKNDPTGIQISGKANNNLYIYSSIDKYLEMPELKAFIEPHIDSLQLDVAMVLIEPKASGKSLKQLLINETSLNVSEIKTNFVNVSKIERARASSPYIESGRVILVKGAWNEDFLHQVTMFPNAKHDEHIDVTAYSIERNLIKKEIIPPQMIPLNKGFFG